MLHRNICDEVMGKIDFFEVVARRHSYRGGFEPTEVSKEHLMKIADAGIRAPSAMNAQTTQFIIIDNRQLIESIRTLEGMQAIMEAPAFIACIVDKNPKPVSDGMAFQVDDCAAAVENMLLAITALGYASVWLQGWLRQNNHNAIIAKLINLPEEKMIRVLLPIGIPTTTRSPAPKLPFSERAWFNSYGRTP